jgi:lipopolysaccharide/colanic/teichoic acid biosynthesis glycosyltransferase
MTAILISLLLGLMAFEAKAWFPRVMDAFINVAVRRLPKRQRERFREEWRAHINDTPGAVLRLWHAAGFVVASGRMFPRWRSAVAHRRTYVRGVFMTRVTRRALDLAIALPVTIGVAPTFLMIALLVCADGPVMFRQLGIGRGGRLFYVYRFRTMRLARANGADPFTPVGRYLRRTALDQLPQLINVLRGDMSLVGARPSALTVEDANGAPLKLGPKDIQIRAKRGMWEDKPGMTGLAIFGNDVPGRDERYRVGRSVRRYFRAILLCCARALRF